MFSDIKRPHPKYQSLRTVYVNNPLSLLVAVGNLPRSAFITSSASVKYRSPKVPVILECNPIASRPACPATINPDHDSCADWPRRARARRPGSSDRAACRRLPEWISAWPAGRRTPRRASGRCRAEPAGRPRRRRPALCRPRACNRDGAPLYTEPREAGQPLALRQHVRSDARLPGREGLYQQIALQLGDARPILHIAVEIGRIDSPVFGRETGDRALEVAIPDRCSSTRV